MRHLLVATVVMAVGCPRPEPVVFEVTANQEPVASMTAPLEVPALVDVSVDGAASFDVDGTITEWSWTFDPGLPPVTGPHATFRYDHPGLFTVELRVTDDGGKRGRARQRIRVLPPPDVEGPLLDAVTLRAAGQVVAPGMRVAGGTALEVEAHVSDVAGNLARVTLVVTGPVGQLALTPSSPQVVSGAAGVVTFSAVTPDAAGTLEFTLVAEDSFHNASPAWTATLQAVPAGADSDADGLPDATDPDPIRFNGMNARVYLLEAVPRDLLQRQRAEAVSDAVRAASPVFTGRVGEGFLHTATSSAAVNELPGLGGAPSSSSLFAVRYSGTLIPPAGADSVRVGVGADDIGVVFLSGQPVASADREYALDFFRVDLVPVDSQPVPVTAAGIPVEILLANEDGPYAWDVRFTFSNGATVVLGPAQVGRGQFVAD